MVLLVITYGQAFLVHAGILSSKEAMLLYAFFWVIPRRLEFICRRFGTPCLFYLHRQVGVSRMN